MFVQMIISPGSWSQNADWTAGTFWDLQPRRLCTGLGLSLQFNLGKGRLFLAKRAFFSFMYSFGHLWTPLANAGPIQALR